MSADKLTRNWIEFRKAWEEIHRIFGVKEPGEDVRDTCWARVKGIDATAWPFIVDQIAELENKPRNMSKAMRDAYNLWCGGRCHEDVQPRQQPSRVPPESKTGNEISQLVAQGFPAWEAVKLVVEQRKGRRLNCRSDRV